MGKKFRWLFERILRCAEMKTPEDYYKEAQNHPDWPQDPEKFCGYEWKGWDTLLATHLIRRFLTFDQLLISVRIHNVDSKEGYYRECLRRILWPMNPQTAYPDEWPGWNEFFQMASSIKMLNENIPIHLVNENAQS